MSALGALVRARLSAVAQPERADAMQAYMKSAMPFLGVPTGPLRQACKLLFADLHYADADAWQADVLDLWRGAEFREERYAALELAGIRAARPFQRIDALPFYEEMIVSGAWWDHVDVIATQRLPAIATLDPAPFRAAMLAWSRDDDMWKRRSAILWQNSAKGATDVAFLYACIEPSLGSKQFFLRKAIGWALRQYARTDPEEVRRYVEEKGAALSPLSRREALKHVPH